MVLTQYFSPPTGFVGGGFSVVLMLEFDGDFHSVWEGRNFLHTLRATIVGACRSFP